MTLTTCTTGASNSALGDNALYALTTASSCTGIGSTAGYSITTGGTNTAIGAQAGYDLTTGTNNLCLGWNSGRASSPGGAQSPGGNGIFLGDNNISEANIQVDWTVASDARDKTDFTDLDLGLAFVNELNPVTYKWDKRSHYADSDSVDLDTISRDGTHKEDWLDIGFKAQEVEKLEESAGYKMSDKTNLTTNLSQDGKQYGLQYSKFVPILVKAIQELSAEVNKLKEEQN